MDGENSHYFEFGEYRLDPRRRSLSKNGEPVAVTARNFDLLLYLVENDGRILEHDELLDKVWAGTFVEQATLKKGISALRQVLAEGPGAEFIKTIPRRGYSFVSPVRQVAAAPAGIMIRETEREVVVEEYEEIEDAPAPPKALPGAPAARRSRTKWLLIAGGVVVLLVGGLFAAKYFFTRRPALVFSADRVRTLRLTNSGRFIFGMTISPDGSYLAYPQVEPDGVALWVRQTNLTSGTKRTIPEPGSFWSLSFAPDNSYVYYVFNHATDPAKSGLFKVPLLGDGPQRIAEKVGVATVSPDGRRLLLIRNDNATKLSTIDTNGADERPLFALPPEVKLWSAAWTPDGAGVLLTVRKTVAEKALYYLAEVSLTTGQATEILPAQERVLYNAAWLPDKGAMLVVAREPNADVRQIWQYTPGTGDWSRVTNDDNSYHDFVLTRDGRSFVTSQSTRAASIWIVSGDEPQLPTDRSPIKSDRFNRLNDSVGNYDRLDWLADGKLVYAATENRKEAIFSIYANGSELRQVTPGEDGIWLEPAATGDGAAINFLSLRSGSRQGWRVDADGKNAVKITDSAASLNVLRVLRDNATKIFGVIEPMGNFLRAQLPNGQIKPLTQSDTGRWDISSDEKLLAAEVMDRATGQYVTALISLADGAVLKSFPFSPVRRLRFTPDGKGLAYDVQRGDADQIMVQPLDGGPPYLLTEFTADRIFDFAWSRSGRQLAVIRGKMVADAVLIQTGAQ